MKFSKWVGALFAVLVIGSCFLPWVYIETIHKNITGFDATGTNFGKPGLMNCIVSIAALVLFLIPKISARRANIFVCAFNLAWTIRNFIIIPACLAGDCPEKKVGIYCILLASILMLLTSLFPKEINS